MLRWRSQPPFNEPALFARRLAADGITEEEFFGFLGEPLESVGARLQDLPPWLMALSHAFGDRSTQKPGPLLGAPGERPTVSLLNSIEPLLVHGLARIREQIKGLIQGRPDAPFTSATVEAIFVHDLPRQLFTMLGRTLVLELNVARLEGLLDGDTPEDRFRSFVQNLRRPEVSLAILHEYPVLARQLTSRIDQWVAFIMEFLGRLCSDWDEIRSSFFPDKEPGVLVSLQTEVGDRHRSGRSVVMVEFNSGFRLIYKPKSMAADVHFQELLKWFSQRDVVPPLRTLQILDRGTHGWVEFVAGEPCDSEPALSRFYERQGAYLALLYVLRASDFHCDNVIAAGEYPVLVDLEAIFHPTLHGSQGEQEDEVETAIENSVLRVGLLPLRIGADEQSEGVDISGLGGAPGQITPYGVPGWEKPGTDEMRFVRKPMTTSAGQNRPSLNGSDVSPCDYVEEICAGFTTAYRLLLKHRDELLSSAGPLQKFADDEVRVLLRGTKTYGLLLDESFHPDVLREALDRDLLLDRLWVAAESLPYLAKVISAEREDLQNGDIPVFTTRPAVRDLWTSSNQLIRDFFDGPGMVLVQCNLQHLGERDLELQLWLIRASLATVCEKTNGVQKPAPRLANPQGTIGREQLLTAARGLGDRLESLAICTKQDTSWIGLALEDERYWAISPLRLDLYGGLPGITLFLAYLGVVTGERRYTSLAQQACDTLLRRLEKNKSSVKSIGAFSGWGGVIYTLSHLGALWRQPELLSKAEAAVAILPSLIEQDEHLDIIAGAAGCIGALLGLYDQQPWKRTLDAAVQCGERLTAQARRTAHGVGWVIAKQAKPLAGFSHGAAGMAWALLKLAAVTQEERFRTTALAAIAHERSLFCPEAGNWRDLRVRPESPSPLNGDDEHFMTAWCHGAPGIGLARLSTLQQLDDVATRREIDIALKTTLDHGFGQNHSLCHGDLGNLEFLLQAGEILKDSGWCAEAYRIAGTVVESVVRNESLCGTPLRVATPGLMTGLAGIGYGLLRLAEPGRVPSVLTLAPSLPH